MVVSQDLDDNIAKLHNSCISFKLTDSFASIFITTYILKFIMHFDLQQFSLIINSQITLYL